MLIHSKLYHSISNLVLKVSLRYLNFSASIFKIWCVFYMYNASEFRLISVQEPHGNMGLKTRVLHSTFLEYSSQEEIDLENLKQAITFRMEQPFIHMVMYLKIDVCHVCIFAVFLSSKKRKKRVQEEKR